MPPSDGSDDAAPQKETTPKPQSGTVAATRVTTGSGGGGGGGGGISPLTVVATVLVLLLAYVAGRYDLGRAIQLTLSRVREGGTTIQVGSWLNPAPKAEPVTRAEVRSMSASHVCFCSVRGLIVDDGQEAEEPALFVVEEGKRMSESILWPLSRCAQ